MMNRKFLIIINYVFLALGLSLFFQNCQKSPLKETLKSPAQNNCDNSQICQPPSGDNNDNNTQLSSLATGYRLAYTQANTPVLIDLAPFLTLKSGIQISIVSPPRHGTLEEVDNLKMNYTSQNGFIGIDGFQYQLTNGKESTVVISGFIRIGPVFYVDAESGNDSFAGTTPASAWKSLAQVNSTNFSPGSIMLLKRGSVWRESLVLASGTPTRNNIFGAYGSGAKPQIWGSKDGKVHTWTETSPQSHLWRSQGLYEILSTGAEMLSNTDFEANTTGWSLYTNLTNSASGSISRDTGQALVGASSIKLSLSHTGSTFNDVQFFSSTTVSLAMGKCYVLKFAAKSSEAVSLSPVNAVKLLKSTSPYTNYGTPLYHPSLFTLNTDWKTFAIQWTASASASDVGIDFVLGNIASHSIDLWIDHISLSEASCTQPTLLNYDIGNIIFENETSNGWKKWELASLVQERDFFYDPNDFSIVMYSLQNPGDQYSKIELAENRYILNGDNTHDVTVENLDLRYGGAHGLAFSYTTNIYLHNLDISWMGGGVQGPLTNNPVRYGNAIQFYQAGTKAIVDGCKINEIYDAGLTPQGSVNGLFDGISFYNNFVEKSEYCYEYFNTASTAISRNIKFNYNTCKDSGFGWGHIQRPDANGSDVMLWSNTGLTESMEISYNLMLGVRDWSMRLDQVWNGQANLLMDYNLKWPSSLGDPQVPSGSAGSIAVIVSSDGVPTAYPNTTAGISSYVNLWGLDIHSLFTDPMLSNATEVKLSVNSPAINFSPHSAETECVPSEIDIPLYCLANLSIDGTTQRDTGQADLGRHFLNNE